MMCRSLVRLTFVLLLFGLLLMACAAPAAAPTAAPAAQPTAAPAVAVATPASAQGDQTVTFLAWAYDEFELRALVNAVISFTKIPANSNIKVDCTLIADSNAIASLGQIQDNPCVVTPQ